MASVVIMPLLIGYFGTIGDMLTSVQVTLLDRWVYGVSEGAIATIIIMILIIVVISFFIKYGPNEYETDDRGVRTTDSGTYGTGRRMEADEIRDLMNCGDIKDPRMVEPLLGTILNTEEKEFVTVPLEAKENLFYKFNGNMIYFGGSGIGKTLTFLINQVIQIVRRNESFLLTDPKLEIYKVTAHMCKECGYNVYLFATKQQFMKFSARYNLIGLICPYKVRMANGTILENPVGYTIKPTDRVIVSVYDINSVAAKQITKTLIDHVTGENRDYWINGGSDILTGLIMYVASSVSHIKSGSNGLPGLYDVLVEGSDRLRAIVNSLPKNHPSVKILTALINGPAEHLVNFYQNARQALDLFSSSDVAELTRTSDFDLLDLATKKTAIFIGMDDQDGTFSHLSQLIINQAFAVTVQHADFQESQKCEVPVNFVFEEAANIGEIMFLPQKISTIRSRNINIILVVQSLEQVTTIYKDYANTIIGNCHTLVFSGISDPDTLNFVEFLGGPETVIQRSERILERTFFESLRHHPSVQVSEGEGQRSAIPANEARTLDDEHLIVVMRNRQPMILEKFKYYDHPFWKKYDTFTYPQKELANWYVELLKEREQVEDKKKESKQTWLYSPECDLFTYSTGEIVPDNVIRPTVCFDADQGKWLIDNAVMIHQLKYPIIKKGTFYYAETEGSEELKKVESVIQTRLQQQPIVVDRPQKRSVAIPKRRIPKTDEQPQQNMQPARRKELEAQENQITIDEQLGTDDRW